MRYFLLDKITAFEPGKRACGIKCVTLTDDILHDHFPDQPLLPGALLLESMSQLGGFLGRKGDAEPGVNVLWRGWQRLQDIADTWTLLHPPPRDVPNA